MVVTKGWGRGEWGVVLAIVSVLQCKMKRVVEIGCKTM